jgi:glycosyltransferase involved in cell wall biosynthesis
MSLPTVSILVLTYNRIGFSSKYIPEMLDKIGNISYEVLILDNCSNDGTYDWLLEYSKCDPRITNVFHSDSNLGVESINILANESKCKYILKIDDDLTLPNNFVERLVFAYEKVNMDKLAYLALDMRWPNCGSFATRHGMSLYTKDNGKVINIKDGDRVLIHNNAKKWMVNGACRLSKRETFLELGGHPTGRAYGVDTYVSAQAANRGYLVGYLSNLSSSRWKRVC